MFFNEQAREMSMNMHQFNETHSLKNFRVIWTPTVVVRLVITWNNKNNSVASLVAVTTPELLNRNTSCHMNALYNL